MKTSLYTKKQQELLSAFKNHKLRRMNILHGSVRSGKTWISLVLWALWVCISPKDKNYLMVAKTLTTLKRNCLDLLEVLVGKNNFVYSLPAKEGTLFGRKIYLEGANDAKAENKIRGMTLQGAYCDELTLFSEEFFNMLLSRLSENKAKLFGTTNPDSPNHWFKVNYLDRQSELDMFVMSFLIDDNEFLDAKYVEALKKEYTGVFYDRFIRGLWVIAEGLVYPMFDKKRHVLDQYKESAGGYFEYYISIDYGTINPCSMGLWVLENARAVRVKEIYFDSKKKKKQLTDEEYYQLLEELAGDKEIKAVIVDPSAASFIETIRRHGKFAVRKANNDVIDGIRVTGSLLQANKLFFCDTCQDSIREFGLYRWDEKAQKDCVVKEYDHAMDDIRYMCNTIFKKRLM